MSVPAFAQQTRSSVYEAQKRNLGSELFEYIKVKFMGPTDHSGSRFKVVVLKSNLCRGKSNYTVSKDYSYNQVSDQFGSYGYECMFEDGEWTFLKMKY